MANIHPSAIIDSSTQVGANVTIGPYAIIGKECQIGDGCEVGAHAVIGNWTQLGKGNKVFPHACLGFDPQDLKYKGEKSFLRAGDNNTFREFCTLNRGVGEGQETVVGSNNLFMAYTHVAHDCRLGNHIVLANCASLAGHTTVEDHVTIGGLVGLHQYVRVGKYAIVGGGSSIVKDVAPYVIITGDVPKVFGLNMIGLHRGGFSKEDIKILEEAYRLLFRSKLNTSQALESMAELSSRSKHVTHLVDFIKNSQRGIHK